MPWTAIFQTFSNTSIWMKTFVFWLKLHWNLLLCVQLTITLLFSIGLGNRLLVNRQQAIAQTNVDRSMTPYSIIKPLTINYPIVGWWLVGVSNPLWVKVKTCCLFSTKPWHQPEPDWEPMLTYSELDIYQEISIELKKENKHLHRKIYQKMFTKCQPFCATILNLKRTSLHGSNP